MAGQSANLSLKEACAMQHRVQHSGSHANNNGGHSSKKSGGKSEGTYNSKKKKMY